MCAHQIICGHISFCPHYFLSQEKLAELANISTKHLTKIENEKVTPSVYMVYKLAKVLDTTIDNLCDNF